MNPTEEQLDKWFEEVDCPTECDGCNNLVVTPDAYGTGDSPTDYSCDIAAEECPVVQSKIQEWIDETDSDCKDPCTDCVKTDKTMKSNECVKCNNKISNLMHQAT